MAQKIIVDPFAICVNLKHSFLLDSFLDSPIISHSSDNDSSLQILEVSFHMEICVFLELKLLLLHFFF